MFHVHANKIYDLIPLVVVYGLSFKIIKHNYYVLLLKLYVALTDQVATYL